MSSEQDLLHSTLLRETLRQTPNICFIPQQRQFVKWKIDCILFSYRAQKMKYECKILETGIVAHPGGPSARGNTSTPPPKEGARAPCNIHKNTRA